MSVTRARQRILRLANVLPDEVRFPVEDLGFTTYTIKLGNIVREASNNSVEIDNLSWVASQRHYSISLTTWLPLQPGGNVTLAAKGSFTLTPPADLSDREIHADVIEVLVNEIEAWCSKVATMFAAARRVENAPDLGPLPEQR